MLVSERIGQFFVASDDGRDRLEYTEYGAGDAWVVLLPAELAPRRMLQPLAHALAAEGLHVVTLDLLGHGRSDRPDDPCRNGPQDYLANLAADKFFKELFAHVKSAKILFVEMAQ